MLDAFIGHSIKLFRIAQISVIFFYAVAVGAEYIYLFFFFRCSFFLWWPLRLISHIYIADPSIFIYIIFIIIIIFYKFCRDRIVERRGREKTAESNVLRFYAYFFVVCLSEKRI